MKVLVFGTFDNLHPGHADFFRQAKLLGDELHVVVARDATVLSTKKRAPDQDEAARQLAVRQHPLVTKAHLGKLGDKYAVIEEIQPDVIALGYDQTHFTDALAGELAKRGIHAKLVRLKSFHPDTYKSSLLRQAKQ